MNNPKFKVSPAALNLSKLASVAATFNLVTSATTASTSAFLSANLSASPDAVKYVTRSLAGFAHNNTLSAHCQLNPTFA
ncbi:Uncharacterised protein [Mycoplasmopsis synoviae]|uniref:Uncharacterized protein n=1 Tax=Mycoplasmopsis synoviae TaxID=2109 RepID=A0A3B0P7K1_MYCSY|nr:Uncharacterised protein [Mycoplasmopsis synoviae]